METDTVSTSKHSVNLTYSLENYDYDCHLAPVIPWNMEFESDDIDWIGGTSLCKLTSMEVQWLSQVCLLTCRVTEHGSRSVYSEDGINGQWSSDLYRSWLSEGRFQVHQGKFQLFQFLQFAYTVKPGWHVWRVINKASMSLWITWIVHIHR
jgi:hypothetical protein